MPDKLPADLPMTWLVPCDGAAIRADARARVGEDAAPPEHDGQGCPTGCDACRKASRAAAQ